MSGSEPAPNPVRPKKGDRYRVTRPFEAGVLTQWAVPYTGGSRKLLPRGLEFEVFVDPPPAASAVGADPIPHQLWEPILVDAREWTDAHYCGYHLVIRLRHLATVCEKLAP